MKPGEFLKKKRINKRRQNLFDAVKKMRETNENVQVELMVHGVLTRIEIASLAAHDLTGYGDSVLVKTKRGYRVGSYIEKYEQVTCSAEFGSATFIMNAWPAIEAKIVKLIHPNKLILSCGILEKDGN